MTKDEALDLALEALEYIHEGANNQGPHTGISWRCVAVKAEPAIKAIKQARALDEMAKNARELGLDYEPVREDWGPGPHEVHSLPPAAPVQEPVAYEYGDEVFWNNSPDINDYIRVNGKALVYADATPPNVATPPAAPVQADPDEQVIRERDEAEAIADALAEKIAAITGCEIGEHTSANSPWHSALDAADEFIASRPPAAPVQEPVECQYGNGGYACCEGGPCKADEQNNSAPDLLNALKRIVDEPNNTMSDGKALKEIIRIARAAIAKETGEQA